VCAPGISQLALHAHQLTIHGPVRVTGHGRHLVACVPDGAQADQTPLAGTQPSLVDRLHRRKHVEATIEILTGIGRRRAAGAIEIQQAAGAAIELDRLADRRRAEPPERPIASGAVADELQPRVLDVRRRGANVTPHGGKQPRGVLLAQLPFAWRRRLALDAQGRAAVCERRHHRSGREPRAGPLQRPTHVPGHLRTTLGADRALGLRPAGGFADAGEHCPSSRTAAPMPAIASTALETAVRSWRTSRSISSSSARSNFTGAIAGTLADVRRENASARAARSRSRRDRCPRLRAA
jgi:hypothetical protein